MEVKSYIGTIERLIFNGNERPAFLRINMEISTTFS